MLSSKCDLQLHGWCDADWACCLLTRRSLTGWLVFLGTSPVSWKTKKQHIVSRSSAEAEYISIAMTTCELKWLKGVLTSLSVGHHRPMMLYCDSQAALHISRNSMFHERTKHIEVDCHFVRDEIVSGNLSPSYISTTEQLADIFTKALGKPSLTIFFASWAFGIFMYQLEGAIGSGLLSVDMFLLGCYVTIDICCFVIFLVTLYLGKLDSNRSS